MYYLSYYTCANIATAMLVLPVCCPRRQLKSPMYNDSLYSWWIATLLYMNRSWEFFFKRYYTTEFKQCSCSQKIHDHLKSSSNSYDAKFVLREKILFVSVSQILEMHAQYQGWTQDAVNSDVWPWSNRSSRQATRTLTRKVKASCAVCRVNPPYPNTIVICATGCPLRDGCWCQAGQKRWTTKYLHVELPCMSEDQMLWWAYVMENSKTVTSVLCKRKLYLTRPKESVGLVFLGDWWLVKFEVSVHKKLRLHIDINIRERIVRHLLSTVRYGMLTLLDPWWFVNPRPGYGTQVSWPDARRAWGRCCEPRTAAVGGQLQAG